MEVEYREIKGFPGYRIGSDGSVWTCLERYTVKGHHGHRYRAGSTWKRLATTSNGKGYVTVGFCVSGVRSTRLVHRLVLEAFVGESTASMQACHGDGDKTNNRLENLRWDTPQGNWSDRKRHGRSCHGEKNTQAKLTESQVRTIRNRCGSGEPQRKVAADFGVSGGMVAHIMSGRKWGWLT